MGLIKSNRITNTARCAGRSCMRMISDKDLDNYYSKDYYGLGTDYFDGPYDLEEEYENE